MAKTILVADDDRGQVELIQTALMSRGYSVLPAYDGEEAYELAVNRKPDLIILDVRMPKLDGDLLYTYLKAKESPVRAVPVIIITGLRTEKEIFENKDENMFAKPIPMDKLFQKITELIETKKG